MSRDIIIIAAVAENNAIGRNNKLPWYIKEDFLRFKKLTLDHPIIMGRKTFLSLPIKPLPKRENIVLTKKGFQYDGIVIQKSLEDALGYTKNRTVYIIGGESIYKQAMKFATKLEITKIHKSYANCDTFFPEINISDWDITTEIKRKNFSFLTYQKRVSN